MTESGTSFSLGEVLGLRELPLRAAEGRNGAGCLDFYLGAIEGGKPLVKLRSGEVGRHKEALLF